MDDWVDIASKCSRTNPPICVKPPQAVHRKWDEYFSQRFVKSTRNDSLGNKVNISEFHWFNFGVAEVQKEGEPVKLAYHPGEVWMRRTLDVNSPWTIVDLRRNAPRERAKWGSGIKTSDLPPLSAEVIPISDPRFDLYSGPLPLTKEKIIDLHKLSKYLSDPEKAKLYPAYVPGQPVKDAAPGEEPAQDVEVLDEDSPGAAGHGSSSDSHSGGSTDSENDTSSSEEENLIERKVRRGI